MMKMRTKTPIAGRFALALLGLVILATAVQARAQDPDVQAQIEVLAEEIAALREQLAIPETDEELRGAHGMGPAASKVYGVSQGISVGGYGEFYFGAPVEERPCPTTPRRGIVTGLGPQFFTAGNDVGGGLTDVCRRRCQAR